MRSRVWPGISGIAQTVEHSIYTFRSFDVVVCLASVDGLVFRQHNQHRKFTLHGKWGERRAMHTSNG